MHCNINLKYGVIMKKDYYTLRISLKPGFINAEQLKVIAYVIEKFGNNKAHITTRQGIEFKIPPEYLEDVEKILNSVNLSLGSTGNRVRQVVSCVGLDCYNAIGDAVSLARKIHEEFEGVWVPKKVKINVSGCPNSCTFHRFCDIGLCYRYKISIDKNTCTNCGKCKDFCDLNAIDWKHKIIRDICTGEGRCVGLCDVFKAERVISMFVGGRGGRIHKEGKHLIDLKNEDDVLFVIDELISLYAKFGKGRMADFVEDYGIENLKNNIKELIE
ncbi:hypothetical protein [Methanocaldococcus fervens]|uniref:Nitrite and sulphite reductase 4Fe-4S region n=1 Tax=Methanocaldococcus fervens (strain DSM 4213 / JCM 15782 / AG86) TaxID=573064 RepID=C7P7T3_METFA|nr:hypothetical protein [Methanocaldococcus fervens]ACV24615.1 nitrite and sulphite reductase 4Fe-4S region [Methanocaldococcus fervens AG86]